MSVVDYCQRADSTPFDMLEPLQAARRPKTGRQSLRPDSMRIIYLHQYFNTPAMPGSTRSFELGRRLVANGHTVEMVTSWREPKPAEAPIETDEAGIRVHWLPVRYSNYMGYFSRLRAFAEFAIAASRLATRLRGDVIYASSTPLTIGIPAVVAARRQHIPMVFEVRDLWPELPIAMGVLKNPALRWLARRLERFCYGNASHIVALSPGMAEGIARAGYSAERISIVPNSADLDLLYRDEAAGRAFRDRLGIASNKIVVGYAGTLGQINGVGYLVKLAAALQSDDRFAFVIVGDGKERSTVEALARELGLHSRSVKFVPTLPKSEMRAVFSGIDIATSLFIPLKEMEANSANKLFDAMAAGCCVAINYGGWQEQLLAGAGAGFRLPADPETAAAFLRDYADNRSRIDKAGQNARRLAETRFSRDEMAAKVEAVLLEAVSPGSRPVPGRMP